jgi:hypothetical protein
MAVLMTVLMSVLVTVFECVDDCVDLYIWLQWCECVPVLLSVCGSRFE